VNVVPPSAAKLFTLRQRQRLADCYGNRPTNDWWAGDLPAPYAEGDLLLLPDGADTERLNGAEAGYFVVVYATSVDEGDAWYFRVSDGRQRSDRLHVASAERSTWPDDHDWMSRFELVESADPDGLALRERMLADGWAFTKPGRCPTCGALRPTSD
jgi:hypothetical protein